MRAPGAMLAVVAEKVAPAGGRKNMRVGVAVVPPSVPQAT